MKIEIITSTNGNPKYLSCLPVFVDFWLANNANQTNVEFVPRIYLIQGKDEYEISLDSKYERFVTRFYTKLPTTFVSQNIRTLASQLSPFDFAITSDIDMLPLSTKIFKNIFKHLDNSKSQVVIVRDVLPAGQYAVCYTMCKPSTWEKLYPLGSSNDRLEISLRKIFESYTSHANYVEKHGGKDWWIDQIELFKRVSDFEKNGGEVLRFTDTQTGHRRLDRAYHRFPINWLMLPFVLFGNFSDYHVHHPVRKNIRYINLVLAILNLRNKWGVS